MPPRTAYSFVDLATLENRPIHLFGAGMGGQCAIGELRSRGIGNIVGILDNASDRAGQTCEGLPIINPAADQAWLRKNPLVILTPLDSRYVLDMERQCREMNAEYISYSELTANSYAREAPICWADAASRDCFQAIVDLFHTHDWSGLPPPAPDQYFQPFFPDRYYRSFVDGGAYAGDTLTLFRQRVGDNFDAFHAFEPDRETYTRFLAAAGNDPRIRAYNLGLSDRRKKLFLTPGAVTGAARLVAEDTAAVSVDVDTLDAILAGQAVTFIKLDIEGAELDALAGARRLISEQAPALAICVYHRPSHLWEIPNWIQKVNPSYRLFLRHHSGNDYETVCYAVP